MPDTGKFMPQDLAQTIHETIIALLHCGALLRRAAAGERDLGPEVQQAAEAASELEESLRAELTKLEAALDHTGQAG